MKTPKHLVQSTLSLAGYKLVRTAGGAKPTYGLPLFFSLLKQFGFNPRHVIDVGANHGDWTREAIKYFPDAEYTLIEPQDHLKMHIQDLTDSGFKLHWINAGVGDRPGSLLFTISSRDDSSSFAVTQQQAEASRFRQIPVRVLTLNEIVSSRSSPPPDMIKIDAEGFDLKALAGASEMFGRTEIFLVEAMVCASGYENTISEVIRKMDSVGYRLMDITELNRSPKHGVLWLCELAFIRNDSPILQAITSYE